MTSPGKYLVISYHDELRWQVQGHDIAILILHESVLDILLREGSVAFSLESNRQRRWGKPLAGKDLTQGC